MAAEKHWNVFSGIKGRYAKRSERCKHDWSDPANSRQAWRQIELIGFCHRWAAVKHSYRDVHL
jgi:hypothetical protein